jgi:ATP adenylyltransferase
MLNTDKETAIYRIRPPEPLTWLHNKGLIQGRSLDYGTGHGTWFGMQGYDPYWLPTKPTGKFETITCLYVLNVVPETEAENIIWNVFNLLKYRVIAYFTVRRDLPKTGKKGRGTWQRFVTLPFRSISKTGTREIYMLEKG